MKKNIFVVILFFISICVYSQSKPEKHALIIAIGKYPTDTTGWPSISAANDVGIMKTALEYQGFENINVIQDKQATKEGIIKAITDLTNNNKVKAGDIVIIHFSSHGQQVEDFEKDESDKLDEAIVAYDAPCDQAHAKGYNGKYKGEKHFKDDDFGKLIEPLRIKLGADGDLVVFIDACHSGTGTRGDAKIRGGFPALVSVGFKDTITETGKEVFLYEKDNIDKPKAHYVVFSGARANELNYEYKIDKTGYGSLSYALSKALTECEKDATYRSLFAKVLTIMTTIAPNQNPTVEGDIDRGLFGGNVVAQEPYLIINSIKNIKTIVINGGKLSGIYDSSKVAVYPTGTVSIEGINPLTTGYVVSAGTLSSTVILKDSLKIKNKNDAWVFVTEKTTGDIILKVMTGDFKDKNLQSAIESDLKKNKIVEFVNDSAELTIQDVPTRGSGMMIVKRSNDGGIVGAVSKINMDSVLLTYAQGKFIREFEMKDSTLRLEMEFVPVIVDYDNNNKITFLDIKDYMNNGIPEFDTSVTLMIKVKNKGKKNAYFNIIDIQPDGKINAVIPSLDTVYKESPEYCLVKAGTEWIIPDYVFSFAPPFGKETYKVFGTKTPIDLTFAVSTRGTQKRGNEQAIEKLFQNTYSEGIYSASRGNPKVTRITSSSGVNTFNYMFIIKEK